MMAEDLYDFNEVSDREKSDRELLLEIARDTRSLRGDMAEVKTTLFGKEDKIGLVARVIALEKDFNTLLGLLKWLGAGLAAAVGLLLWGIFTGQVQITFP